MIKTIRESLSGNTISSIAGILNGTCNYILTKICEEGKSFKQSLQEAQDIGYAEADPTLDIEGMDTAHKLAIINTLAFGMPINLDDIYVEGITSITLEDILNAKKLGYTIKLLAISKSTGDSVEARIHPTMLTTSNLFSNVNNSMNAVYIHGDAVDDLFLVGRGAGMMPTASAVISDITDISRSILSGSNIMVPLRSWQCNSIKEVPILPIEDIYSRYYFRFSALDSPGVLSTISGILGKFSISIKSVQQTEEKKEGPVPIVMLTSLAREKDVQRAIKEIDSLDITMDKTRLIRIEEDLQYHKTS